MFSSFLAARNLIDFPLRKSIRWRRPLHRIQNEGKEKLFTRLPTNEKGQAEKHETALRDRYRLAHLYRSSSRQNYRENLYYLELLIAAFGEADIALPSPLKVADIGVSHWFYVQAFYHFFQWYEAGGHREVSLTGFEVDPYRVYADFRSRFDHALAHMGDLAGVDFVPDVFRKSAETYDFITMFFPFVFRGDHLRWGLPNQIFQPKQLLADAWSSVKPGGGMLIVNQGLDEHKAQKKMLAPFSTDLITFKHESLFFSYDLPRYVLLCVKSK